jgi:hypothetical protein
MVPSLDTYLYNEIECKLQIILSNRYIIEEILKAVQPKVATNFIRAYSGEGAREIPIVYTLPQDKQTQQGAIYIGLREGEESKPSLGNMESTYEFKAGSLRAEAVMIQATEDKTKLYLEVTENIGELINVEGISFSINDNMEIDGKLIYFNYDPDLEGLGPFTVNYVDTFGEEIGMRKGFTATEQYSILAVSTNMDTVRCLDLIIKSILILMRSNPEELNANLLQRVQYGQMDALDTGRMSVDETPELLYGRETIVAYTVSYSLDEIISDTILKAINLNVKFDG